MPVVDPNEFEMIIDAHWAKILGLAQRMTGNRNDAEEVAQQTFFLAYQAWDSFERRSETLTWLFRIAVNACKQHMIKRRRENGLPLDKAPPPISEDRDPIESREQRARIGIAMQAISPKHRMVLTLFCFEELGHEAIAEILGCPVGTVWSRLYSARAALAQQLNLEME